MKDLIASIDAVDSLLKDPRPKRKRKKKSANMAPEKKTLPRPTGKKAKRTKKTPVRAARQRGPKMIEVKDKKTNKELGEMEYRSRSGSHQVKNRGKWWTVPGKMEIITVPVGSDGRPWPKGRPVGKEARRYLVVNDWKSKTSASVHPAFMDDLGDDVNAIDRKLTASQRKMLKLMASQQNLKSLNALIKRGHITADEVVKAIEEALKLKRVNPRLAETIAEALRDVFDIGEVIDVGKVPLAR